MLLHYLVKLKTQIFCRYSAGVEEDVNNLHIYCLFVIHPEILIFLVFKIASCSPHWLQIKFSMSLFFYLFTSAINLWHWKLVTADVTAVFVNNQHGIQQQEQEKHINTCTLSIHSYTCRGIKISALKMQFIAFFIHICWISPEIWIFFYFPR